MFEEEIFLSQRDSSRFLCKTVHTLSYNVHPVIIISKFSNLTSKAPIVVQIHEIAREIIKARFTRKANSFDCYRPNYCHASSTSLSKITSMSSNFHLKLH